MEELNMKGLKRKSLISVFWKFSERILAKFVSLFVAIILARLLEPADYSVTSIVSIFFAFANVFITGGFNTALIQKKDADKDDYSSVFFLSEFIAVIMYIALFIGAPSIAKIYSEPVLIPVIRVMGCILFINALNAVVSARVSSSLEFKKYFFATLGGTVVSAVVGITMAARGFGCWALVAQHMCNTTIDTIILLVVSQFRISMKISFSKLKVLFNYGGKIFLASIISAVYDEINPLIIGLRFSNADLAYYSKGKSFPAILNSTAGDTLSAVLFPVAAKLQNDPEKMLNAIRRYMRMASFVIFPTIIGFMAVARTFVAVVLTPKWLPAAIYIQLFCVVYMFDIIQKGNIQVIQASGRSDLILKMEILKKSLYFIVIAVFIALSNEPYMLAVACIVNTLIATVINTFPNCTIIGYKYGLQIRDIGKNLFASVLMGIIVWLVGKIEIASLLLLPLQIVIGGVSYVVINILIKNPNLQYCIVTARELIKGRKRA